MLVVISPSKTLDFSKQFDNKSHTIPVFLKESEELVLRLRKFSKQELMKLLRISETIAEENFKRFAKWDVCHPAEKSKIAILAFKGEAYENLKASTFTTSDFEFTSRHLRILSGLYGLLRPLDFVMPYRLEMGTRFENSSGKDLYKYWKSKVTYEINKLSKENNLKTIINLASSEYFKVINETQIELPIINIVFKQEVDGEFKTMGVYSKRARGMMANFIVKNRISQPEELIQFIADGYKYNTLLSTPKDWVYTR